MSTSLLVSATEAFIKADLAANDASHDFAHVDRVRNLALRLARDERIPDDRHEVIELAALLHDFKDYKYSKSLTAGEEGAREFLTAHGFDAGRTDDVISIIKSVGFKREAGGRVEVESVEHGVVQDADRLDAIGAIGIARTFSFGGSKGRPFYDPESPPRAQMTTEEYIAGSGSSATINHFHEKLLKLKDLMKTPSGRVLAAERHEYMVRFLEQFACEVEGTR